MNTLKVTVKTLVEKMLVNRQQHLATYEKAVVKHRERAIAALQQQLALAKDGKKFSVTFTLNRPQNFVKEYDTIIGLLRMSEDTIVELTIPEYKKYVEDDWNWRQAFEASNSKYLSASPSAAFSSTLDVVDDS